MGHRELEEGVAVDTGGVGRRLGVLRQVEARLRRPELELREARPDARGGDPVLEGSHPDLESGRSRLRLYSCHPFAACVREFGLYSQFTNAIPKKRAIHG